MRQVDYKSTRGPYKYKLNHFRSRTSTSEAVQDPGGELVMQIPTVFEGHTGFLRRRVSDEVVGAPVVASMRGAPGRAPLFYRPERPGRIKLALGSSTPLKTVLHNGVMPF